MPCFNEKSYDDDDDGRRTQRDGISSPGELKIRIEFDIFVWTGVILSMHYMLMWCEEANLISGRGLGLILEKKNSTCLIDW